MISFRRFEGNRKSCDSAIGAGPARWIGVLATAALVHFVKQLNGSEPARGAAAPGPICAPLALRRGRAAAGKAPRIRKSVENMRQDAKTCIETLQDHKKVL
jgi:hypothetical protein